jgi:prepilin-type processing-associated H-X9-DG protein
MSSCNFIQGLGAKNRKAGRCARSRAGLSTIEIVVAVAVVTVAVALTVPWVLGARGAARLTSCRDHLRTLAQALHAYHAAHQHLPAAAEWNCSATSSLALHKAKRIDLVTNRNWAQLLLPFAGEESLGRKFDSGRPVSDPANAAARTTRLALMSCPDDSFNRDDNPHRFFPRGLEEPAIAFARGNYAINGGTHSWQSIPPTTAFPKGDFQHIVMQAEPRLFQLWGNGIAGINRAFSIDEFSNGQATLVALEEVRAGIHPLDPRGVWALGQIGGSITWAHGINGDDYAPNHLWSRSDDILGCKALHEAVGPKKLTAERMPCVDYIDANGQATSRSMHPGGVHVAFLDGSVKFVADTIDPGVWHVIHSRETPAAVLAEDFDELLAISNVSAEAQPSQAPVADNRPPLPKAQPTGDSFENSIGMRFLVIPAGEFTMGIADVGNENKLPSECPAHRVRVTRSFVLGVYEVTCGQYSRVKGAEDADRRQPTAVPLSLTHHDKENLPVSAVTWDEAAEFCRCLSLLSEERAAGRWYRLPTEAEWEYACRNGKSEPYRWKPVRRPDDQSGEAAGVLPTLPITPVGSYPPNELGLFDMRGNVWEWTADWFDRDYYARSPVDDPQGPARGFIKVVRGGDWRFAGEACHIDYAVLPPWKASPVVGFRVVCEHQRSIPD